MWRRAAEVGGLVLGVLGWAAVGCTLAMDAWRVSAAGGQGGSALLSRLRFWSDLWRDCHQDSTAVVNCVELGVLSEIKGAIQATRGLLVIGLCVGMCGVVLTFLGMECTRIGGGGGVRTLAAACAFQLLGGVSDAAAYCLYINRMAAAFLHSKADPSLMSYEMGLPVYLGLAATLLIFLGSIVTCCSVCIRPQRREELEEEMEEMEEMEAMRRKRQTRQSVRMSQSSYQAASVVIV